MTEMKFCQSCAMPMGKEELHGDNADGSKNEDYCVYCYKNGVFAQDCTMEEMMEECSGIMVREGLCESREAALKEMRGYFPKLRRWAET